MSFGFDRLIEQSAEHVAANAACLCEHWQKDSSCGETPIERLMFSALYIHALYAVRAWSWRVYPVHTDAQVEQQKLQSDAAHRMIVQSQVQLEGWRVDFLIHTFASRIMHPDFSREGWRQLIVECDGHDFHERNKEQAARDRSRDRDHQLKGYEVFRFTGSELWRDPWGCADQVFKWAEKAV